MLRSGSPRLVIQEFWAWMTATLLVRASAAASLTTDAAAARALRRREASGPVTTDQVSFTAARHHAVCSMIQSKVTAGTSLAALAEDTSRATLHTLVCTGRQRHSPRGRSEATGAGTYGWRNHARDVHRHRGRRRCTVVCDHRPVQRCGHRHDLRAARTGNSDPSTRPTRE